MSDANNASNDPKGASAGHSPDSSMNGDEHRYSILVCVDGTDESYNALDYAVRLASGNRAAMTLLYVRPIDQGLRTGGLQASVAREQMLSWGLELPGMRVLKTGRDKLIDAGFLGRDWDQDADTTAVQGDPLGDQIVTYTAESGRTVTLKLIVATSVVNGILDECDLGIYDLVVVPRQTTSLNAGGPGFIDPSVAEMVALEHSGTVLAVSAIEQGKGHLICVTGRDECIEAARKEALIAARCACPVYVFSAARDETQLAIAEQAVEDAVAAIEETGIQVSGRKVVQGDPVTAIIEEGRNHSVIVMAAGEHAVGWRRFFTTSVAYDVLKKADTSVMIVR